MCEMMEKILEKTNAEGKAEGRAEGRMVQLYELVKKGFLTVCVAADEAHQTETEFKAGMDAYYDIRVKKSFSDCLQAEI